MKSYANILLFLTKNLIAFQTDPKHNQCPLIPPKSKIYSGVILIIMIDN